MFEVLWFKTTQCMVRVYDTKQEYCGKKLYVIISHHESNGKDTIRFGTKQQLYNMLDTYKNSVVGYRELYENYMKSLSVQKLM